MSGRAPRLTEAVSPAPLLDMPWHGGDMTSSHGRASAPMRAHARDEYRQMRRCRRSGRPR